MAMVAGQVSVRRRMYLFAEYFVLFFGVVTVFITVFRGVSPIPFLVVLGAGAVVYLLRQPTFDRGDFLRTVRPQLRSILTLWAVAWVVAIVGLSLYDPTLLWDLPRRKPVLWLIIMVAYPLLSAYPQELVFRGFLFHRYGPAFGARGTIAA
ncbi:hypothetical protein ACFQ1S_42845, partial [Kibdelosporangium lantanae]